MPIGRGLSSLIPPKDMPQNGETPSGGAVSSSVRQQETRPTENPRRDEPIQNEIPATYPKHKSQEAVFQIEIDKIVPNPYQPRKEFSEEAINELSESIKQFGIIQPLIVSKSVKETETGTKVEYQLIAGERRLKAAKRAGLAVVPVIIKETDHPGHKLELALIENIQRRDLNAIEEAKAYSRLQDEFGLTQKEIALRVGKSREVVANSLRLLNLPLTIQTALSEGKINESQARALLSFQNPADQEKTFRDIMEQGLSVRNLRKEIIKRSEPEDPEVVFLKKKLEEYLGLPVRVTDNGGRGKITIEFFSREEIKNLIDKLGGE
ncbi:ParB/RepB/Spo0J family partition protein [Patescibacteria group bacterium]|nr:ParB/RepB/Spo0J family partition protein [Patescibacteria group bacterium]